MNRATTRGVDSVISRTWQLRDELHRATPERFRAAREDLKRLLAGVSESQAKTDQPGFLDLSYPLVCWIDEQMTGDSRIGNVWSEALLETEMYGTNDGEWMFWKQAELAERLATGDALEVFFQCAANGFTGCLRNDSQALDRWLQRIQERIARTPAPDSPFPTTLASPPDVMPLHGRRMMRAMLRAGWAVSLVLLPTLSYIGMRVWVQ